MSPFKLLLVAALSSLALTGCGASNLTGSGGDSKIQSAYDSCHSAGDSGWDNISVADGGASLIITGAKSDEEVINIACMLSALGTPSSLVSEVDSTTAEMGRQNESAGGLTYRWSYHPDNGLDMTVTE